ncbi:MAG: hypothetical protein R6U98_33070, partial [Pirellulaceae bacterium]
MFSDGDELGICKLTATLEEDCSENLDPLNPDTDGDGLQDGQEVNGYKATYFKKVGDDNKEKSRQINNADPFRAYKKITNDGIEWLDTDKDQIWDVIEGDPVNMTKGKFDDVPGIEGFRSYYNEYKGDEEDINDQFNPNVYECIIPITDNINVDTESDVGWTYADAWADITVDVMDTAGIEKVILEVTDRNNKVTLYREDAEDLGNGWLRFETTIDISYSSDYLTSYKVKVKAVDVNGNSFVTKEKVNGVFGGVISAIVDAVAGFLADAWEAAKGLADMLWGWVKNKVLSLLEPVIE